jgi:uncharacterized protein (TIGR03790 family)
MTRLMRRRRLCARVAAWLAIAALGLSAYGMDVPGQAPDIGVHASVPARPSAASVGAVVPATPPATEMPASAIKARTWIAVPRIAGRLTYKDIGLVINIADPYSVEVGAFYVRARELASEQVLRVELPLRRSLTADEFRDFDHRVSAYFGAQVQALALAWVQPYAVACNSLTAALAFGFDDELCKKSCDPPLRHSRYFNSSSTRPYTDLGLRPSMLLAADDVAGAKAMILRGVASDHTLGLRGAPPVNAYYVTTSDRPRSSRAPLFPPPGRINGVGVDVHLVTASALEDVERVLLYMTGAVKVDALDRIGWMPGAMGDHLTSTGGELDGHSGQMTAKAWIASGATGSYGTVSEPCSHPQKFPHPQVLLLQYVQGSSLIEAYWKSVAWPQQGLFIGEPLAAPFARR